MSRQALLIFALASTVAAQVDGRLWLVSSPGIGSGGSTFEVGRDGTLRHTWPGPAGGSGGVIQDPFENVVLISDDQAGQILVYRAGSGLVGAVAAPGIRGLALQSNGDIAVLIDTGFLSPALVQIIPRAWILNPSTPWPPALPVGLGATRMLCGPGNVLWVLNTLSANVSRIQNGAVQFISYAAVHPTTLHGITLTRDGGLVVTFNQGTVAAVTDDTGAVVRTLTLPQAPLRCSADADASLLLLGDAGTLFSIDLASGAVNYAFLVAAGTDARALIPDQDHVFWLEDAAGLRVIQYGYGGVVRAVVPLTRATSTLGDPMGIEMGGKANPGIDLDGDGIASGDELRRGGDMLDGFKVPAQLSWQSSMQGVRVLNVWAPNHGGATCLILGSLTGMAPYALGPLGRSAPYVDLIPDLLTDSMIQGDPLVMPYFSGMPATQLDASGAATAQVDFSTLTVPAGTVSLHIAALVIGAGQTFATTSNVVTLTN